MANKIKIEKIKENNTLTALVEGRIDTATAGDLSADIKASLEGITDVKLDFKKVEYISSSGLRVVLELHKILAAREGVLTIYNVSELVYKVFEITGFVDMLNIQE